MPKKVVIKKDPQEPIGLEVMERAIVDIAEGARKLLGSRLEKRALLLLLKDRTGVPMETISVLLDEAAKLDKSYLK